jgi:hypothetical protein
MSGDEIIQFGSPARLRVTSTAGLNDASQSSYDLPITLIENDGKTAYTIKWNSQFGDIHGKTIHYLDNSITEDSNALVASFIIPEIGVTPCTNQLVIEATQVSSFTGTAPIPADMAEMLKVGAVHVYATNGSTPTATTTATYAVRSGHPDAGRIRFQNETPGSR